MPVRIAIASFEDETMTFMKEPTTIERFEPGVRRGEAMLAAHRGKPDYINGYLQVLEPLGVDVVPILEANRFLTPGPFSSWITNDVFETYAEEIAERLQDALPLDGVLLCLHGAMAVDAVPKPEAELARRVRAAVGDVPIMVTLDMHANEDHELTDTTDAVFILKTYPHVDSEDIGRKAAQCMVDTIQGRFTPTQACCKPGLIIASIYQGSEVFPMKAIYDRCREWEEKDGVYAVSCAAGFAYSDVPDVGMSIIAVTDNDLALAERITQDVAALAWKLRDHFSTPLPGPEEAGKNVMELVAQGKKPVVMCDGADRVHDSTHLTQALLEAGATNWCIPDLCDPEVTRQLAHTAELGQQVTVKVGGWYGPLSGEPVEVTGTVEYKGRPRYTLIGPMGRGTKVQDHGVVWLNLGDNRQLVISEYTRSAIDAAPLVAVGIEVESLDIIGLKSRVHHRAYWDTVCEVNYPIDAPGYREVPDLTTLEYHNIPDDIYPIGKRWRTG